VEVMMYKLLDLVVNPDWATPNGTTLPNVVGEDAITFLDVLSYILIYVVCAGLFVLAVREIRMIKHENM
jgi:hypothetical protein